MAEWDLDDPRIAAAWEMIQTILAMREKHSEARVLTAVAFVLGELGLKQSLAVRNNILNHLVDEWGLEMNRRDKY
jgi:hypothetical protein